MSEKLHQLAEKYHSDKLTNHSYIPLYEELFKGRNVKRLLEIGIGYRSLMEPFIQGEYIHGSSLYMWMDYFPEAEIFACDIREDTLINEERIHSMVCDQSSAESLDNLIAAYGWEFDAVIDDGSHQPEHQLFTAKHLIPAMKVGSLYVIEDVRGFEIGAWIIQELAPYVLRRRNTSLDFNQGGKRPDDNLVVCKL